MKKPTAVQLKNRAMWLKALRSGKYMQATRKLCIMDEVTGEDNFCCLGLYSELHKLDYEIAQDTPTALLVRYIYPPVGRRTDEKADMRMPADDWMAETLGIDPSLSATLVGKLAEFNDSGRSFKQIADIIEYAFTLVREPNMGPYRFSIALSVFAAEI